MVLLQDPQLSFYSECSYLEGESWRFEYFFALNLDGDELEALFDKGWRKFGAYFFRPRCENCTQCVPIRVLAREFIVSKKHRRILRMGGDVRVAFKDLEYRDEIFDIYKDHNANRFNKDSDMDEFIGTFYTRSCPSIQSEYYLGDRLMAVGFLDVSSKGMSSVYFIYRDEFKDYSPGIFSILKEIEYTASCGLSYYYLGYYVEKNHHMSYKNRFYPYETLDWLSGEWSRVEGPLK